MQRLMLALVIMGFLEGFTLHATEAGVGAWTSGGPPGAGLGTGSRAVAVDPQTPSTLYAATATGLYKTGDGGQSWTLTSSGLESHERSSLWNDLASIGCSAGARERTILAG